ncbi:MAG: hypothetical protein H8E48_08545 [Chloroflexi bacterium]|nr:hypothetical protein [Chloroflexota bacterium]
METPLLVPSFSSKALEYAKGNTQKVFEVLHESMTEAVLISAYDLSHQHIQAPEYAFAEVMFLDSGGFEASTDHDLMDPLYPSQNPKTWTLEKYQAELDKFVSVMPMFISSFDHPAVRMPLQDQIVAAIDLFKRYPYAGREFLIKPETIGSQYLKIPKIISEIEQFSNFDIIGFTEEELGQSVVERMTHIARIRSAMDSAGIVTPIHIFGSLDPVCTPLYFLAGADIFDGLSWIRFSYWEDLAVYHRVRGALDFGGTTKEKQSLVRSYDANLQYLNVLTNRMKRYLVEGDEMNFETHSVFVKRCLNDLRSRLKGVV